ncbi:hypothetical protein Tsp_08403 [Trichinella spiralis]|uniref:hypothetical protein n=1 Tax=Trichinella spiralis TaxID=6334 RepID=UPI0001EFB568|nr:hypothetical protein Tsp_08403 [Trichinella spiralis]
MFSVWGCLSAFLHEEQPTSSLWQDKVERSLSLRKSHTILSTQCGDSFCTAHENPSALHPDQIKVERVEILSALSHDEPPSTLHPGEIKWNGHSCGDPFCTFPRRTTFSSSPWQDKVERSFSLRKYHTILSTQCGDPFCTFARRTTLNSSPWRDKVERSFSLRKYQTILSTQCEDPFCTFPRRTTLSSSPWQDKVERSFSLRKYQTILSTQCGDPFCTFAR